MAETPRIIHINSGESQRMRNAAKQYAEPHMADVIVRNMKKAVADLCRDTNVTKQAAIKNVIEHVTAFVGNPSPSPESNPSPPPDDWVEPTLEELDELERLLERQGREGSH